MSAGSMMALPCSPPRRPRPPRSALSTTCLTRDIVVSRGGRWFRYRKHVESLADEPGGRGLGVARRGARGSERRDASGSVGPIGFRFDVLGPRHPLLGAGLLGQGDRVLGGDDPRAV